MSHYHKYVMHSGRSTIAGVTVAVAKQFTSLWDASGRPLFQVPLTHAQQIQRGTGHWFVSLSRKKTLGLGRASCCHVSVDALS